MKEIIQQVEQFIRKKFEKDGSGHDWWHIHRVRNNALLIAKSESVDMEIIELAALLHDIADHKFYDGNLLEGPSQARELLLELGLDEGSIGRITTIIAEVSYKGSGVETPVSSLESAIVQDADRLDAIGAIGIARAFAYGGHKDRLLYHPDKSPTEHDDFEAYRKDEGATINHFYEKLLLLKDRMNTNTAKSIATERHAFMENYLDKFYNEWNGEKYSNS